MRDRRRPGDAPTRQAMRLLVRSAWEAGHWLLLVTIAEQNIVAVAQIAALFGAKVVVDGAASHSFHHALAGGVVMAVAMAARQMCSWADSLVDLRERTAMLLEAKVVDLSARLPGIAHHERPELLDQLELVREQRFNLGDVVYAAAGNLATWGTAVVSVVLLVRLHPAFLLVMLAGLVSMATAGHTERLRAAASERVAEDHRLTLRLEELARLPAAAGELRLHRLQDLLLRRHREAGERVIAVEEPAHLAATAWTLLGSVVFSGSQLVAIAFAAYLGAHGRLSIGDVVLAVGLVRRAASQLNSIIGGLTEFLSSLRAVRRLAWLMNEVTSAEAAARPAQPVAVPDRLHEGIRLEGVRFRYPGAASDAIAGADLLLPAGRSVALVGENGAGKSTIVKLLLRLYDPDEGRILVDGVDLRQLDIEAWRARASGAFQDPARFELTARQVVGVGDLDRIDDEVAVGAAVEAAGAEATVAGLPSGLATPVGASFSDGVELSGGQWQLLALARAMMRARPLLLVLDEPTAALDPGREHALFERYAAAARLAAAETGGVTVLVSHRFSTVRMADLIVVVDAGGIIAAGTHDELMAAGGLYAELFTLQARAYTD